MSDQVLLAVPIVVPILGAAASIIGGRSRPFQRAVGVLVLAVVFAAGIALLVRADTEGIVVSQGGGWPAPLGISLVGDRLAAMMLVVSAAMLLAVLVYAIGQGGVERERVGFHPAYLVLGAGISASFLVGDLFTLFVAFEMMLCASYVLLTLGGRAAQVRAGMTYVVISLIASILFITALALVYMATGTVNMAQLAGRMADLPASVQTAFALFLLAVFGIKAALFPLFSWLPDSYPTAAGPITAVFAGLLTKVGVYAILRTQTLLFAPDVRPGTLLLGAAASTMVLGVLGAIAQADVKRILSFHVVSQIGYMAMGIGLFSLVGVAACILYIVHHIIVKTSLFLVAGLIERAGGTSRLVDIGGLVRRSPVLVVLFALPALSLAGIPPFSGFAAKLALVQAGIAGDAFVVVAVSLLVGLLTLFSMTKIWGGAFWGPEPEHLQPLEVDRRGGPLLMVAPTAALVLLSLAVAAFAGPLWELSERAAADVIDPTRYVDLVLGATP